MLARCPEGLEGWHRYPKAVVVTTDLVPLAGSQRAFPGLGAIDRERGAALMAAFDACNRRFGRGTFVPGSAGFVPKREWSTLMLGALILARAVDDPALSDEILTKTLAWMGSDACC